jgi:hypothetical protein
MRERWGREVTELALALREHAVVEALQDQRRARVCTQLALITASKQQLLGAESVLTNPNHGLPFSQRMRGGLYASPVQQDEKGTASGLYLPKRSLADARRPVDLGDLPSR